MGILGSITKGIFGGKKKTNSAKGTVSPYAPAIPYINEFLNSSAKLYQSGDMFSPQELNGYAALGGRATEALDQVRQGDQLTKDTLDGKFLTPETNPYLSDIAKRISGVANATALGTFGGRGRSSGGLAGYYSGKATTDSLTDLFGQQYDNERGRQQQTLGQLPALSGAHITPAAVLYEGGKEFSARPYDIAAQHAGILSQIGGLGQQTTQQNYKQSGGLIGKIANSFTNKLFPA